MLVPGSEELLRDTDYQHGLRRIEQSLRDEGVKVSSVVELRESAGGGWHYGEFFVQITPALTLVGIVVGAWLNSRAGRTVRVKVGDIEAEASTPAQVLELLERAQQLKERNEPKRIIP